MLGYRNTANGIEVRCTKTLQAIADIPHGQFDPAQLKSLPLPQLEAILRTLAAGIQLPGTAKRLMAPFPPLVAQYGNFPAHAQFVGVNIVENRAIWNDGKFSSQFPFYGVFQPWLCHHFVAFQLGDRNLGDDGMATDTLVVDQIERVCYVFPVQDAESFLALQWPEHIPIPDNVRVEAITDHELHDLKWQGIRSALWRRSKEIEGWLDHKFMLEITKAESRLSDWQREDLKKLANEFARRLGSVE
jgi:hypothetical protein